VNGQKSRAQRREAARALAKELLRAERRKPSVAGLDSGWYLGAFVALGLFLAASKNGSRVSTTVLAAMALCLVSPIWRSVFVQSASSRAGRNSRFVGLTLVALVLLSLFGAYVWPPIRRHTLTTKEQASFENALRLQNGDDLDVQIACPSDDEKTCTYAQQYINLVGKAHWNVEPYVDRVALTRALDGVTIYRRGGNKEYSSKHRDAGGYFEINEPHVVALQNAFDSIHIEPEGGTNPDLAEKVMVIYFGPEREDEAQPTNLTRDIEWATGKHTGRFPVQQP